MIIGMIRYAVPNSFLDLNNTKTIEQLYKDPYFSDRFKIFCNVTLESFACQTNKDFILLIYHSNLIPKDKKILFDNIEKKYSFIKNIYINDNNLYIPEELKEDQLLTFRIDNDDGITIDFIDNLQNLKDSSKDFNFVISIPHIYKICRIDKDKYKLVTVDYISNSMGLAYLSNNGKTIMDLGNHAKLPENYKIITLKGNGGLQTINNYNVTNKFKRKIDKHRSKEIILNHKDMQYFLNKEKYATINLTCLPIIKD